MAKYIIWKKEIDENFRSFYNSCNIVDKKDRPEQITKAQETQDGRFCIGSSRIRENHCEALIAEFGEENVEIAEECPTFKQSEIEE